MREIVCRECGQVRIAHARGLCKGCYEKTYLRPVQRFAMRELRRTQQARQLRIKSFAAQLATPEDKERIITQGAQAPS